MAASESNIQLPVDGTGKKLRTRTGMVYSTDPTSHQEIHLNAGPDGDMVGVTAYGFMQATGEATTLFYDPFDGNVIDTTNRWNTAVVSGAGAAITQANGQLQIVGGTVAGSYAYVTSQPTFNALIPGYLQPSFLIQLGTGTAAALATNAHRFWGIGTSVAAPTAASPLINGAGFEMGVDGKLYCVVYSNSTRTFAADCSSSGTGAAASTMPFDGGDHRYLLHYRTDRIFFFIDGIRVATATVSPEVQTLPVRHSWINHTTGPTGSPVYTVKGTVVADTAKNSFAISDGVNGWRKTTVTRSSQLTVASLNITTTIRDSAAAAVTASGQTATLSNPNANAMVFNMFVSALTGAATTFALKLQGQHPQDNTRWYDVPGAFFSSQTGATAAGTTLSLQVAPGLPVTAGVSANALVPALYRLVWTVGGATPSISFVVSVTAMGI